MKLKTNLNNLLGKPTTLLEKFHRKTKIKKLIYMDLKDWPPEWTITYFKSYPRLDKIILPKPGNLNNILLKDVLFKRQSEREYSRRKLSLEELSDLVYYSCGIRENNPEMQRNRFHPSGGARYPVELYIVSLNTDLPKGVYHYNIRTHSLETLLLLDKFDFGEYCNMDFTKKSSCIFILTAVFLRTTMKYGDRGYRHIMIETGHIGQNMYLLSAGLNLGCSGLGGYLDDKLHKLLDIDGINEAVVSVTAIGTKAQKK